MFEEEYLDPDFAGFSMHYPPPSVAIAYVRLEHVIGTTEHIRAQLEFAHPDDYETDEEFNDWKRRAVSALAYNRTETSFLERWISRQELIPLTLNSNGWTDPVPGFASAIESVSALFRAEYQAIYTENFLPPDIISAQERKDKLNALSQKYKGVVAGFSLLFKICKVNTQSRDTMSNLLDGLVSSLEKEDRLVGRYIRSRRMGNFEILIKALERSVSEGFSLADEEITVLEESKKNQVQVKV